MAIMLPMSSGCVEQILKGGARPDKIDQSSCRKKLPVKVNGTHTVQVQVARLDTLAFWPLPSQPQ